MCGCVCVYVDVYVYSSLCVYVCLSVHICARVCVCLLEGVRTVFLSSPTFNCSYTHFHAHRHPTKSLYPSMHPTESLYPSIHPTESPYPSITWCSEHGCASHDSCRIIVTSRIGEAVVWVYCLMCGCTAWWCVGVLLDVWVYCLMLCGCTACCSCWSMSTLCTCNIML